MGGQIDDRQMNKMDGHVDGWTIDDDDNDDNEDDDDRDEDDEDRDQDDDNEDNRDEDDDDRHSIPNARVDVFRSRRKSDILLNTCDSETDTVYGYMSL